MSPVVDAHQLAALYIATMIAMAFIQPIIAIIAQIVAVLVIKKVQDVWTAHKNKPYVVHPDETRSNGTLP